MEDKITKISEDVLEIEKTITSRITKEQLLKYKGEFENRIANDQLALADINEKLLQFK